MPTIPTVALSTVPTAPSLGPRMSFDDPIGGAIARAGGSIADVGNVLGRVALQKQDQVNRGYLAGEEAVRMQTAAQIQEYATKNPDKPETWSKFEAETWKTYEQGKSKRAKEQGWGPAVTAQDKILTDSYRVETGIRFKTETDKALIRQSNARLESVASMHLASGNVKGALAAVDGMTLYPEQRQKVVEQITNGYVYGKYDREISDISTLPPAQQTTELAAVEAELTATDKDGAPVNGWVEAEDGTRIGGLSDPGRTDLIRASRARKTAAERQIENEVGRLLNVYLGAGAEEFNRQAEASRQAGNIDLEITASTTSLGFSTKSEGESRSIGGEALNKEEVGVLTRKAESDAVAAKRDKASEDFFAKKERDMREKAQDWGKRAIKGTLSQETVEMALKRGEVMQDDAEALLATIRARGELDTFRASLGSAYDTKDFVSKIASYATMTAEQKDRIGVKQRLQMLAGIDDDPVLGVEAKAQAMRTYLDAMAVDLSPTKWENADAAGPVLYNHAREVNKMEAKTRAQVGRAFSVAPNLGEGWAGAAMIRAEKEITEFFTSDTYKDDEAHAKAAAQLAEKIQAQVYDLAASRLMGGLYP